MNYQLFTNYRWNLAQNVFHSTVILPPCLKKFLRERFAVIRDSDMPTSGNSPLAEAIIGSSSWRRLAAMMSFASSALFASSPPSSWWSWRFIRVSRSFLTSLASATLSSATSNNRHSRADLWKEQKLENIELFYTSHGFFALLSFKYTLRAIPCEGELVLLLNNTIFQHTEYWRI